jgi:hypothetical protein
MFDFIDPAFTFAVSRNSEETTVTEFYRGAGYDYVRAVTFSKV